MASLQEAVEHIQFHHEKSDGWITLAKKTDEKFIQSHHKADNIASKLSEWLGEDVYFSQNTFYKPQRRIENIRQFNALYSDVDCHLFNFAPEWVIGKMEQEAFGKTVPEPNMIIYSGRGFILIWLIESVPYQALPLWQVIERHFSSQFEPLGADPKATDATRIFRVAGSVNSKNGEEVTVQFRHKYRYELRQLQEDYLPELNPKKKKKSQHGQVIRAFIQNRLYADRLRDLVTLMEIRNYDVKGYREVICFLYRYWKCCYLSDSEEALKEMLEINSEFVDPLPEREVIRATRSAEKAWIAKNDKEANRIAKDKGYPGAGYNISNEKLIDWLGITEDEQRQLQTIIGKEEKRRRNTDAKRKKRRKEGVRSREEYLKEAETRQLKAFQLKEEGKTYKEIAKRLGVGYEAVRKMIKRTQGW